MMTAIVYLKEDMDFLGSRNFDPNALYREAAAFAIESTGDPLADCETVFAICNSYPEEMHCDPKYIGQVSHYRDEQNRSLSVGDVVQIGEAAFHVDSFGFSMALLFGHLPQKPGCVGCNAAASHGSDRACASCIHESQVSA